MLLCLLTAVKITCFALSGGGWPIALYISEFSNAVIIREIMLPRGHVASIEKKSH